MYKKNIIILLSCTTILGVGFLAQHITFPHCLFYNLTGLPCPLCGMTTSFICILEGKIKEAFLIQPMGASIFLTSLVVSPLAFISLFIKKDFLAFWKKLSSKGIKLIVFSILSMTFLSWVYCLVKEFKK